MVATKSSRNRDLSVTFILIGYNQESSIRRAIEGAMSQEGPPIEILLSDDCSEDRTFELMQTAAREYGGQHSIQLNRNPTNLGIGRHISRVAELASGDWLVFAAGDDLSLPQRSLRTSEIATNNPNARAIVFRGTEVTPTSESRLETYSPLRIIRSRMYCGSGACFSYHRDCFSWPQAYPVDCWFEDRVLPFRASFLGDVVESQEYLVDYKPDDRTWTGRVGVQEQMQLASDAARQAVRAAANEELLGRNDADRLLRLLDHLDSLMFHDFARLKSEGILKRLNHYFRLTVSDFRLVGFEKVLRKLRRGAQQQN